MENYKKIKIFVPTIFVCSFIFFCLSASAQTGCCTFTDRGGNKNCESDDTQPDCTAICTGRHTASGLPLYTDCNLSTDKKCEDVEGCPGYTAPAPPAPTAPAPAAPAPDQFVAVPPKLEIPIPTLPSLSNFVSVEPQGTTPDRYLLIPWIGQYIAAIYKYAIGIVGILAGIMIVIGGLVWLTAGGSAERVGTAKKMIGDALVGLVIALTSYLILYAINPNLVNFSDLKIPFIEQVLPEGGGGGMEALGQIASGGAGSAQDFRTISCDGLAQSGEEFDAFFTSYYIPLYGEGGGYSPAQILSDPSNPASGGAVDTDPNSAFYCALAMESTCPEGVGKDNAKRCYGGNVWAKDGTNHGWYPCSAFGQDKFADITAKLAKTLPDGQLKFRAGETVAADCNCTTTKDGSCKIEVTMKDGTKKTLQVTDTGSGIRGRRFDFYIGTSASGQVPKMSGVFKVKFLPGCTAAGSYGDDRSACPWTSPAPGPLGPQPATITTSGEKIAVIGDSITSDTTGYKNYLTSNCTGKDVEFFAAHGIQTSVMLDQFNSNVKGQGFKGLIILGGVNDLISDKTAAQIEHNLNTIYTEAKADGLKVTAITVLPWDAYSAWTPARQTQTEALNSWILGSSADIKVNAYAAFGDPSDPAKLNSAYDGGDHLHPKVANQTLGQLVVSAGACR